MKISQQQILLTVLSICFTTIGCFGSSEKLPELTPVTGKIRLNGKPLAGALVVFQPAEGRASNSTTDKEGNYELYLKAGVKGAIAGKHVVKISVEENMDLPAGEKQIVIPARYNSKSKLEATLSGTEPITHNFDLKSSAR